jgi:hypothetical protein
MPEDVDAGPDGGDYPMSCQTMCCSNDDCDTVAGETCEAIQEIPGGENITGDSFGVCLI